MPSINVKVPTKKVIASLEKKLADIKAAEVAAAQYEKDLAAWKALVLAAVDGTWKVQDSDLRTRWNQTKPTLTVTYEVPKALLAQKPKERQDITGVERGAISEIESAIRILKMTDEDTVSASTFKAVSKYL
jgi:hypothetical protein